MRKPLRRLLRTMQIIGAILLVLCIFFPGLDDGMRKVLALCFLLLYLIVEAARFFWCNAP